MSHRLYCWVFTLLLLFGMASQVLAQQIGIVLIASSGVYKLTKAKQRTPLKTGQAVFLKDRIVLEKGAFAQLKMQDDALISLEGEAQLWFDNYHFNPHRPVENRVRIWLEKGSGQFITGKAGQLHKQGFRLNTPVAAIGIRGTNFIVNVAPDNTTKVRLVTGAVVVAPLGQACQAQGFGACRSPHSVLLDQQHADAIVVVRPGEQAPVLIRSSKRPNSASAAKNSRQSHSQPFHEVGELQSQVEPYNGESAIQPVPGSAESPFKHFKGFYWGRFAKGLPDPEQQLLAVGKQYWLAQEMDQSAAATVVQEKPFELTLQQADAVVRGAQGQVRSAATIQQGYLSIDLQQRRYSTTLEIATDKTVRYQTAGQLSATGNFSTSENPLFLLQGRVDKEARTAAYLFVVPHHKPDQYVEGVTVWSRE